MIAPNYHPTACCANCDYGTLVNGDKMYDEFRLQPFVVCDKYGIVHPGGVCDTWEED